MEDFCFVVFSHADNEEKEAILYESLKSIGEFKYPIILASHLPVSRKNQDLVDYFIKDKNGSIIATSTGNTKKDAENNASREALLYYNVNIQEYKSSI